MKIYNEMEQAEQRELQSVRFKDQRNTISGIQPSPVFQEILHGVFSQQ